MKRLVLLISLAAAPAQAYEFICGSWDITGFDGNGCPVGTHDTNDGCDCRNNQVANAPKWYGAQVAVQVEREGGNGITATEFVSATQAAARAWTDVTCSNFQMDATVTLNPTSSARWGTNDSEHGVFFITGSNEWMQVTGSGAGGTLGITAPNYNGFSCTTREFIDADVVINGFVQGGWTTSSVKSVVMHELGHVLGLGHPALSDFVGSCSPATQAVMAATTGVDYPAPQQDDTNGICTLYPGTPGGLGSSCTTTAQCTSGPCITYQNFTYCSQTCTGTCPTGYSCTLVNSQNVCTRQGAPNVGEACSGACAPGATCLGDGTGAGKCYKECDPAAPQCAAQDRCVELQGGGGVCWPPGTQQVGEECGGNFGDCAASLLCLLDVPNNNTTGHCYRECDGTNPGSCGSGWLCYALDASTAVCLAAAGPNQDCVATQYVCVDGYVCVPSSQTAAECYRECDYHDANSCGTGMTCATLVDQNSNPVGGACFPAGNGQEGDACVWAGDCADGMLCVGTPNGGGECLVACTPATPNCPHAGQTCDALTGSAQGVCTPAGQGGPSTGKKGYLAACTSDDDCISNQCETLPTWGDVCLQFCDPRLGHRQCPYADQYGSGCVPANPNDLYAGGRCEPGVQSNATLSWGDSCDASTGYRDCYDGLCQSGQCLTWCDDNGTCPDSYFKCDQSEPVPGVCKPAGGCGCQDSGSPVPAQALTVALFALRFVQTRRRRSR